MRSEFVHSISMHLNLTLGDTLRKSMRIIREPDYFRSQLDITLNGASLERQEQYDRLFRKRMRRRRQSSENLSIKKLSRQNRHCVENLHKVSSDFFFNLRRIKVYMLGVLNIFHLNKLRLNDIYK